MKIILIFFGSAVFSALLYLIIRWIIIRSKRPQKTLELAVCIEEINHAKGHSRDYAFYLFARAYHLVEFYGIPLPAAGYLGDLRDLADDVGRSVECYEKQHERYWRLSEQIEKRRSRRRQNCQLYFAL